MKSLVFNTSTLYLYGLKQKTNGNTTCTFFSELTSTFSTNKKITGNLIEWNRTVEMSTEFDIHKILHHFHFTSIPSCQLFN